MSAIEVMSRGRLRVGGRWAGVMRPTCVRKAGLGALTTLLLVSAALSSSAVAGGTTDRVSVNSAGTQGNSGSFGPSISAAGRHVAFVTDASNLVAGDTNGTYDIFVHDRRTKTTERVSVDSAGVQGNAISTNPSISAAGRHVAFVSDASNLVADDTNGDSDIFVHDRRTETTERVSVNSAGGQANAISNSPSISARGRYVAFISDASNLVRRDTNGDYDIFVHDRRTKTTERVSVNSAGGQGDWLSFGPSISAGGRHVAFDSYASNLVAGDTNGTSDVFVHDRRTKTTERVSVDGAGTQGNLHSSAPSISARGRYVAFYSIASNLVAGDTNGANDIFVHDRRTGTTERMSVDGTGAESNSYSSTPSISARGRYVAFESYASNLVAGDTNAAWDVFVHARALHGVD